MAKVALIQRELKRDKLAAKYAAKYAELKAIANDAKKSDEERAAARLGLQKLPRNANPTRQRNRCEITGRPRGTFRQFGLARAKIRELKALRLSVHRTSQHIYAQIFDVDSKVLAVASTVQKDVRGDLKGTGNIAAAAAVGKAIAEKAKAAGIKQVAFDRSGYKYHGRIKALADAARENGLEF